MNFLASLLMCDASLQVQLSLLMAHAAFWRLVLPVIAKQIVAPFVNTKPWKAQWIELNQKTVKSFGIVNDWDTQTQFNFFCEFIGVLFQHAIGSLCCVPALLGWFSPEVGSALACHGGLCEAGWELQDGLTRAYQVIFGGDEGRKKNPPALCAIMAIHHTMGISMVIPMNLHFPHLYYYHELVFLLQFAAALALACQNYGYTLDVSTRSGLLKMRATVIFVFITMFYSRAARYVYVTFNIVMFLYAEGGAFMCVGGGITAAVMALFNILLVMDSAGKLVKFLRMDIAKDAQPALLREASSAVLISSTGIHGVHQLTKAQSGWAKLRGARALGVLKRTRQAGA